MSADRQKSLDAGCVDYISKPINEDLLLEKINKYLTISNISTVVIYPALPEVLKFLFHRNRFG